MVEIKLTEEDLMKLAKIAETIKEKGLPAAEKMVNQFKAEFKVPPGLKTKAITCADCIWCGVCGPTAAAWVGTTVAIRAFD